MKEIYEQGGKVLHPGLEGEGPSVKEKDAPMVRALRDVAVERGLSCYSDTD